MLRRRLLWLGLITLLVMGMMTAIGAPTPRVYANVTLVSFTAQSLNGLPEVYVKWETATEIDTAGFYVQRSLTNQGDNSYTRLNTNLIPATGDSVTGALYDWTDETTTSNTTYYYRLEEVPTDAAKPTIKHDPVAVIAGLAPTQPSAASPTPTNTPTATSTRTPTPTPTLTLTPRPGTTSTKKPVATNPPVVTATPHLATGATITPLPTTFSAEAQPTAIQQPGPIQPPAATLPAAVAMSQPTGTIAVPSSGQSSPSQTEVTRVSNQAAPPNEVAAAPVQMVTPSAPDAVEPSAVVVTENAASNPTSADSRGGGLLLIVGAAVFLLVGAFFILRQANK